MLLWLKRFHDDQPSAATRARQREDAGRRIVIVEAVAIGATLLWHLGPEQVPDPGDICRSVAVSEEAVMANAVLALGQNMDQDPADELIDRQCHGGVPTWATDAVVLDAECDAALVHTDQAAVGDCDTVRVARQVRQHRLRPCEGLLGIHDPLDLAQRSEQSVEGVAVGEVGVVPKEAQLPGFVQPEHPVQNEAPIQTGQNPDGEEEIPARGDPLGAVCRQTTAWNDHVDVGVMRHR